MTIWFDVEDLVHYFGSGNKRISGIQRLSFEIFRAAKALEGEGTPIGFVRHGVKPGMVPLHPRAPCRIRKSKRRRRRSWPSAVLARYPAAWRDRQSTAYRRRSAARSCSRR